MGQLRVNEVSGNDMHLAPEFTRMMATIPPLLIQLRSQDARPMRTDEDTGAFLSADTGGLPDPKRASVWAIHPPWKNGVRCALLFEVPADLTSANGIRFSTRSAAGRGDGVAMTVEWKALNAPDNTYQICYQRTIREKEWTDTPVKVSSGKTHVLLRFRFDCGPADDAGYDKVEITNLDGTL